MVRYKPTRAGTHAPLPECIQKRYAVISPQNTDEMCFRWAIMIGIYSPKGNAERIIKQLRLDAKKLDLSGLEWPMA